MIKTSTSSPNITHLEILRRDARKTISISALLTESDTNLAMMAMGAWNITPDDLTPPSPDLSEDSLPFSSPITLVWEVEDPLTRYVAKSEWSLHCPHALNLFYKYSLNFI